MDRRTRRPVAEMTSAAARISIALVTLQLFLVLLVAVVAHPWQSTTARASAARDPRIVALHRREAGLRRESLHVRRVLDRRWAIYRRSLAKRQSAIDAARRAASVPIVRQEATASYSAPSVRVVTLPAQTITRTS